MRSTWIVRKLDDLGRIVIPKETRKVLGIKEGDSLEVFYRRWINGFKKISTGLYFL